MAQRDLLQNLLGNARRSKKQTLSVQPPPPHRRVPPAFAGPDAVAHEPLPESPLCASSRHEKKRQPAPPPQPSADHHQLCQSGESRRRAGQRNAPDRAACQRYAGPLFYLRKRTGRPTRLLPLPGRPVIPSPDHGIFPLTRGFLGAARFMMRPINRRLLPEKHGFCLRSPQIVFSVIK